MLLVHNLTSGLRWLWGNTQSSHVDGFPPIQHQDDSPDVWDEAIKKDFMERARSFLAPESFESSKEKLIQLGKCIEKIDDSSNIYKLDADRYYGFLRKYKLENVKRYSITIGTKPTELRDSLRKWNSEGSLGTLLRENQPEEENGTYNYLRNRSRAQAPSNSTLKDKSKSREAGNKDCSSKTHLQE